MRVLVIGLGSMGKRRIRLIKQIDRSIYIIGLDSKQERREETEKFFNIETVSELKIALEKKCDCAFICTSPLSHADLIETCLSHKMHVFTEINLVADKYDLNMKIAQEKQRVLFLSSTFLYRDEIRYIQQEVENSESLLSYTYHIGQYLPDWHPWEEYTDFFVGDIRTNGCREIMAIDFPWLYKTFGKIKDIQVKGGKKTGLKIAYNDSYLLLVEHETGVQGTIMVDVVSRKAVRNLEIYGEDLYISWDGTPEGLKQYNIEEKEEYAVKLYSGVDKQTGYASFVIENAYKNEILVFFNEIQGKTQNVYDFEDDKYVLELLDNIEDRDGRECRRDVQCV